MWRDLRGFLHAFQEKCLFIGEKIFRREVLDKNEIKIQCQMTVFNISSCFDLKKVIEVPLLNMCIQKSTLIIRTQVKIVEVSYCP
jgi:hypothetical protein